MLISPKFSTRLAVEARRHGEDGRAEVELTNGQELIRIPGFQRRCGGALAGAG